MEITDEMIARFLRGGSGHEEAAAVAAFLETHPEMKDRYLGKVEWDGIDQNVAPGMTTKMWAAIDAQTNPTASRRFSLRKLAIAASLILVAGAGAGVLWKIPPSAIRPAPVAAIPTPTPRTLTNNSDSTVTVALSDGSTVRLSPHSAMTWYTAFPATARDVSLRGKAVFTIAKDEHRPFTVYAEGFATTALGTVFEVNTLQDKLVTVRLLQGRIVIHSTSFTMKEVYLAVGESFVYDRNTGTYAVSPKVGTRPAVTKADKKDSVPETSFTALPLTSVLREVANEYNIVIVFDEKQMNGRLYSGKFLKNQPLGAVLRQITAAMNLKLKKTNGSYHVY